MVEEEEVPPGMGVLLMTEAMYPELSVFYSASANEVMEASYTASEEVRWPRVGER